MGLFTEALEGDVGSVVGRDSGSELWLGLVVDFIVSEEIDTDHEGAKRKSK